MGGKYMDVMKRLIPVAALVYFAVTLFPEHCVKGLIACGCMVGLIVLNFWWHK